MAVTAPAHLRHDHDVNINNFVPYHNTLVENIPCDQETQNLHGWVIWCLQFLWHLLLLLLPLQGLQRLPDALATAVEGAISDTCPMVDIIPEDEQPSYFWDILIAVAFIVFAAACYGGGWMHGWWIGRNYILRRRHVRSDRLQRELDGRLREVLDLQGQVVVKWWSWNNSCDGKHCQQAPSQLTGRSKSSNLRRVTWSSPSSTRTSSCALFGSQADGADPKDWATTWPVDESRDLAA